MGKSEKLVLIKLGGSVITNKDKPLSPNLRNIRNISRQLARALDEDKTLRLVLIHGGGSFGHYYARKFGLGTRITVSASPEGLAYTSMAMIELHSILLKVLSNAGVYCGTILPIELFSMVDNPILITESGRRRVDSILENGLVPITFGYVNLEGKNSYIISGDTISLALVSAFSITKTIFVMDVDGVFPSPKLKGPIVKDLARENFSVKGSVQKFDVTGGIKSKISTGLEIADRGSDVYFVNGTKPTRLLGIFRDSNRVVATKIYSTKKSASHSS
jgi:isopentenyl phosphate kinase